jgi:hypothetical protein
MTCQTAALTILVIIQNTTNPKAVCSGTGFDSKSYGTLSSGSTRWRTWLSHCATSWRVAGSIPDGVIGIFHWYNPLGCTTALELTQPLTEMSTRNISWRVEAASA